MYLTEIKQVITPDLSSSLEAAPVMFLGKKLYTGKWFVSCGIILKLCCHWLKNFKMGYFHSKTTTFCSNKQHADVHKMFVRMQEPSHCSRLSSWHSKAWVRTTLESEKVRATEGHVSPVRVFVRCSYPRPVNLSTCYTGSPEPLLRLARYLHV